MKKIKILLILTAVVFISQIAFAFYLLIKGNILYELYSNPVAIPPFLIFFMLIMFLSFFYISLSIIQGIWQILKEGFFNLKSPRLFKTAGSLIIGMGLLIIAVNIYNIINNPVLSTSLFIPDMLQKGYLILMGYGLIVIADILKNGYVLRQENDLTI